MTTRLDDDLQLGQLREAVASGRWQELQSAQEDYERLYSVQQLIATIKLRPVLEPYWLDIVRGLAY